MPRTFDQPRERLRTPDGWRPVRSPQRLDPRSSQIRARVVVGGGIAAVRGSKRTELPGNPPAASSSDCDRGYIPAVEHDIRGTAELLEAWREAIRASELAERLAVLASEAA